MHRTARYPRLRRAWVRSVAHARRAAAAVRRAGPGRHPGAIDEVILLGSDLVVRGHVAISGDQVASVVVSVNGDALRLASMGRPPALADGGRMPWSATVTGCDLPRGALTVEASVISRSGLVERLPAVSSPTLESIVPRLLQGAVDAPDDGSVALGGVVPITGWTVNSRDVDRIEVIVNGDQPQRARAFCVERVDLVRHSGDESNVLAGFRHLLDLEGREPGSVCTISVDAVGPAGRAHLGQRRIIIGPCTRPVAVEDRRWISALSGRVAMAARLGIPGEGLNVLVVAHDLGIGGAQLWLHHILLRLLCEWDVSCTVLSPTDGPLRANLEEAGARVHLMGPFPGSGGHYESKVRELVDRLVDDQTHVVVANTAEAFIGVDAALRCGLPSVYSIHEHYPRHIRRFNGFGPSGLDAHVSERADVALDKATAVGFVSDATRHLYLGADPAGRGLRIDYGIPLAEIEKKRSRLDRDRLRRDHGYLPQDRVLACVAAFNPRKGQAALVMAFSRIAALEPDAHLVLVGASDDWYSVSVTALVKSLDLQRRVRVVELTPEVEPWWVMADGFVLASDIESLPRSIIEAMAHELPVLATDVGGVSELVRDGETGFLVTPNDVGELAQGLRRLLDADPATLRSMARRAAQMVWGERDGHGYTEAYSRLLRGLAKDPGASPRVLVDDR